ncbi:hypothetical protein HCCG_00277 [Helicobacter cinaedi CCUG 18818 = ATCC BAA-847]|uniref:Uncharacterized protein n=1 Tax=Helicobacter cinaedi CCUG 18818 = ATCC BAA-847 TaxID=537971 RepID=A0ABN0B8K9_9HELI|nr:hypothetical protein HCCG_00277 [Helicobacter cinaedi CCUG 18818 = ATCC BAA-847]
MWILSFIVALLFFFKHLAHTQGHYKKMDFENKRVKWFYWGVGVKILWISAFFRFIKRCIH